MMRPVGLIIASLFIAACQSDAPRSCEERGGMVRRGLCECPKGSMLDGELCRQTAPVGAGDGGDSAPSTDSAVANRRDAGGKLTNPLKDAGADGTTGPAGDSGKAEPSDEMQVDAPGPAGDAQVDPSGPVAAAPCVPAAESCDGQDNDCDGQVDEGLKNACGEACGKAVPPEDCATPGKDDNCDGQINEGCVAPPAACVPVTEDCDGKDDDCDGVVDNGAKNACGTCGAVPVEDCDGKDDDCDGSIDEGVKNACGRCGPVPTEDCDGKDNDCDGLVDELLKNACGGPCDAPVPKEDCATAADDNCNGQTNEGCAVCPDARITPPEECDPKAAGWTAFTCGPDCKRNTIYSACATDADCFGSVGRSTVICNARYGVCSIRCPTEGALGTASGCPKPPGNLTAMCTKITGDALFCFASGCTALNESGGGGCAIGTTCAASDQTSWCVNL